MDKIALLPGFFAAFFAFFYTPERAFMSVYLPCLLLIPNFYRADIQGLPDLNFNKAAVFPIFLALIIRKKINTWNLSLCDFLVLGYLFCIVYSEYTADLVVNEYTTEKQLMHMSNGNYSLAQNLLSNKLLSVFFPYVLAKYLIHPKYLTIPVAKRLVFIAFTNLRLLTQIPYSQECVNLSQKANLGKIDQKSVEPEFCNSLYGM